MEPYNLARSLFCCRAMKPVNRIGTFNEDITNFTTTVLHGADTANPVMLDPDEAYLVDEAPYIISYEKRWGAYHTYETVEGVRYFIPEPETEHFLEIPSAMYQEKHGVRPFHHNVHYVKYSCRMDNGYLFVCHKLVRGDAKEKQPVQRTEMKGGRVAAAEPTGVVTGVLWEWGPDNTPSPTGTEILAGGNKLGGSYGNCNTVFRDLNTGELLEGDSVRADLGLLGWLL